MVKLAIELSKEEEQIVYKYDTASKYKSSSIRNTTNKTCENMLGSALLAALVLP